VKENSFIYSLYDTDT